MTDLHPLQENIYSDFFNNYALVYLIASSLVAIFFFKFYSPKTKKIEALTPPIITIKKKPLTFYLQQLEQLTSDSPQLNQRQFYQQLNQILKEFIEEQTEIPLTKMTLKEIKRKMNTYETISNRSHLSPKRLLQKDSINKILENTYFPEFQANTTDSSKQRQTDIKNIQEFIKQYPTPSS